MSEVNTIILNAKSPTRPLPAEFGVIIVGVLVLIYFGTTTPNFASAYNVRVVVKELAQLAIVSTGMTLVIATGGIDISVGSVLGLSAMVLAWLNVTLHHGILFACAGALLTGCLCGAVNGFLIAKMKLPPIIVTLATFAAARAGTVLFHNGNSISPLPLSFNELFDGTDFAQLPILFWISMVIVVFGGILLKRTTYGRELLSLGGNRVASQLSGIRIVRTEALVYIISGTLAGIAAIINAAVNMTGSPSAGQNLELTAITAVVLGGTAITGGQATMVGTLLGVLTIGALISGIRLGGHEDQVAWFLVGAALLLAVEVQKWRTRRTVH